MKIKSQGHKVTRSQVENCYARTAFLAFCFSFFSLLFGNAHAKEIVILYTGETHAMLYHCNCPIEPDGGLARRATLLKQLRKGNPSVLLVDSGAFFAGGTMDEYSVANAPELDKSRTRITVQAMGTMQYDCGAIGENEFNFGKDFLANQIAKSKVAFISCNIKFERVLPYLIKDIQGTKVGVIGVTPLSAMKKAEGVQFLDPRVAVRQAVKEVRQKGVQVVVLLSQLGEPEDLNLLQEVSGIDVLIVSPRNAGNPSNKVGSTIVIKPSWQGRRLGKLTLTLQDNKIKEDKIEELRVSDQVQDNAEILSFLPQCFSDANCKKKGAIGKCLKPGTMRAACEFTAPTKIELLVIAPKTTVAMDTQRIIDFLQGQFPGVEPTYLYYPDPHAVSLIKELGMGTLPIYLLSKDVGKEAAFENLRNNVEPKGAYYMLKPSFSGVAFFVGRQKLEGRLDLFLSLYEKNTAGVLTSIRDFHPFLHFLASENNATFNAQRGNLEVEDYLRAVCVQKYYPQAYWDYLVCRAHSVNSSWWEDCLGNLDSKKIKTCAQSEEGTSLLRENISLSRELQVMFGPTYLLNNEEVFGIDGVPSKEDFEKIFSGKLKK